jgi:uncharacterized protein (TIGR03435 family)
MIQAMLADRFGLMTLAKSGSRLREGDGRSGMSAGPGLIRYRAGTMAELAGQLSGYPGRNVIDRTGMTGQ